MPVNDTTTNQGYQKPNIANTLSDDVGRLRSALDSIDTDVAARLPKSGDTMTGPLGVTTGTAGAPSVYFTGDINTGIYSPGADQLAISTAGAGRLFVDASGNVGVGASATGFSSGDGVYIYRENTANLRIFSNANGKALELSVGSVGATLDSRGSGGAMVFSQTGTEHARIDSSGRLGLGTSNPTQAGLVISKFSEANTRAWLAIRNNSTAASFLRLARYGSGSDSLMIIGNNYNRDAGTFAADDATQGVTDIKFKADGGFAIATGAAGTAQPTDRLTVLPDGKVGIGTTDHVEKLEVRDGNIGLDSAGSAVGDRTTERFYKRTDNGSSNGMAAIGMNGAGTNGFLGEIKFYTGASDVFNASLSERVRIDSSGRLLVGTSNVYDVPTGEGGIRSPGLQRAATTFADSTISSTFFNTAAGGGGTLSLARSNTTTLGAQAIASNNDVIGAVYFSASDGTQQIRSAQIFAAVDGTPGTNDMPGRLVFSTTADGASTSTERMRISADGAVKVAGDNFQIATSKTPASATATGTTGQIAWDASYIYVCTATNTWKRAALSTW